MSVMAGGSLTGLTVTTNESLAVNTPSLTVTVIVVLPNRFAAGVTVTVRLAPLPPSTTFASGTRVVFDDARVTVRLPAAVSASPIVNAIGPVDVSSFVVRSAMSDTVGAVLVLVTVSKKVSLRTRCAIVDRDGDGGRAGLIRCRRHRHRPVRPAAPEHDVAVRHECRVAGGASQCQAARRRLHVAHGERDRARRGIPADRLIDDVRDVGASFAGVTVSTNVSLAVSSPSLTVTVIVAVPDWLAAGVTVTVRFAPLPPNTTLRERHHGGVRRRSSHRQAPGRRLRIANGEGGSARSTRPRPLSDRRYRRSSGLCWCR